MTQFHFALFSLQRERTQLSGISEELSKFSKTKVGDALPSNVFTLLIQNRTVVIFIRHISADFLISDDRYVLCVQK